jgi:hypothetical protein
MPLAPQAPYDSLATITQMVRTLLGDYVQNIQPFNQGVVSTNAIAVTWVSGNQFSAQMNGAPIVINGVAYTVAMVTSPTTLNLVQTAGVQVNSPYTLVIPAGDFFADSQPYVLPTINLAWRRLQTKLADKGHPRLENTAILTSLPVIANLDPAVEQYINWMGFFDGVTLQTPGTLAGCPVLPPDFISPLKLEERMSVAGATAQSPNLNRMLPMRPAADGLRSRAKGTYNRVFDWRQDAIYFRGATLPLDLKIRYAAFLPDIAVGASFAATPVPIMGAAESLANYSASIFVTPRGSSLASAFDAAGDEALLQITNMQAKLQQRASYSRQPWGSRFRFRRSGT